ncbi:dihydrofolate reductase [Dichomitus squalens]|uniref:Dihydrofolate reductase n=1 Tax=Dichomitus squalens TaxID=114155 RepID=A0A4Q9ND43_9APHY|nr:dihydrofolate reductase [Dichomitus squalens]TBU38940.1 dihydrofolate reductase [Dichomitus squalens]TBU65122.1 dihydrofolate reductase [Dichomitus squalens]
MTRLTLIVAATRNNGIGQNSHLPWRLAKEMAYFKRVTTNAPEGSMNAVVMGRNTWESIPQKFRPLNKRLNLVISSNTNYQLLPADAATPCALVYLHSSLDSALERLSQSEYLEAPIHRTFIIGGASLYRETLALLPSGTFVDRVLLTRILAPAFEDCDVFMPDFLTQTDDTLPWRRVSHAELQEWVGFDVVAGEQEENGVQYEFQMWVR